MQKLPPPFPVAVFCPRKKKRGRWRQQLGNQGQGLCSEGLQIQERCPRYAADSLHVKESMRKVFLAMFTIFIYLVVFIARAAGSAKAFILLLNSACASSSTRCSPIFSTDDYFWPPKVRFWLLTADSPLLTVECRKSTFDCPKSTYDCCGMPPTSFLHLISRCWVS